VNTDWVTLAVLGRTHANRGEINAVSTTSKSDRLENLREAWLFSDDNGLPPQRVEIAEFWRHNGRPVFKFAGIDSISDAEVWQGAEVRVPAADRAPLEEGEYYFSDLVGCEVIERATGDGLGRVIAMQEYGSPSGTLELDNGMLIPFVRSICVHIDTAARRIEVDTPEGLRDLNRP
jgi:16S rRNA processing protein RimM